MKRLLVFVVLAAALCGCSSTGHIHPGALSRVNLGMTKQEVVAAIGNPKRVSAEGRTETFYYVEERPWWRWADVQVKIVNGKVAGYGDVPASGK